MERESTARPRSTRPPSAVPVPRTAMVSSSSRPITQQGLSGLRPLQTPAAGTNRIYRDKRYYASIIQSHMNEIKAETEKLRKQTQEFKISAINKEEYRRVAEETAKKYAEQQELLNVYNTVLDLHLSKAKTEDVQAETSAIKKQNEDNVRQLETMFSYKLKVEEEIGTLKKNLAEEDSLRQSYIDKLTPKEKEEYEILQKENVDLSGKIKKMKEDLKSAKEQINEYSQNISMSKEKQEKLRLMKKFSQLEEQKNELKAALESTLTPEQQREMLLQQVKSDKVDIDTLTKVKKDLEEEYEAKKARLAELEHELDGKDNTRLKKHKELRERGEHMTKFIAGFDEKYNAAKEKMVETQEKIMAALEILSVNNADLDIQLDNTEYDQNQQSTLDGWMNKYMLLNSQVSRLEASQEKMKKEMEGLREKKEHMEKEMQDFENVDGKREELIEEKTVLEEKLQNIKSTLESTNSAVVEAERRKDELEKKLSQDKSYKEIQELEKVIAKLEEDNQEYTEKLKEFRENDKVYEMREKVKELIQIRNEAIIQNLKNKRNKM